MSLTGKKLKEAVDNPLPKRNPIAEGFLYEKSCIMVYADPGFGKSCVSLQAALELSSGLPLFGYLNVDKPHRIYYIMKERPVEEALERIQEMQTVVKWNEENIFLDDDMQLLNFCREDHQKIAIDKIEEFHPDIVIIDPIIAGMTKFNEEAVLALTNFLTKLQRQLGTTHWLNHHTVKSKVEMDGSQKSNPFYGSQFLETHITGSYWLTKTKHGSVMNRKKNSHKNLFEKLEFEFDENYYISRLMDHSMTIKTRFNRFLESRKALNKPFTIPEIMANLGCTKSTVKAYLSTPLKDGVIHNLNPSGADGLYELSTG